MKNGFFGLYFAFLLSLTLIGNAQSTIPDPVGYVNDFAEQLEPEQAQELEQKLRNYEQVTSIQFVVVILNSLQGREEAEVALEIGRKWKVGQADLNNGLVLLWAPNERSYRLEVGPGLEGYITDGQAGSLLRRHFVPLAKNGQGAKGVVETVDAVINHLGNAPIQQREEERARKENQLLLEQEATQAFRIRLGTFVFMFFLWVCAPILLICFVIRWLRKWLKRRKIRLRLRTLIATHRNGINRASELFFGKADKLRSSLERPEDWSKFDVLAKDARDGIASCFQKLDHWNNQLETDPELVEKKITDPNLRFLDDLEEQMVKLVKTYTKAKTTAPALIEEAEQAILGAQSNLQMRRGQGYEFNVKNYLRLAREAFSAAVGLLKQNPADPVGAKKKAEESIAQARDSVKTMDSLIKTGIQTTNLIDSLLRELKRLGSYRTSAIGHYDQIVPYPPSVKQRISPQFVEYQGSGDGDWVSELRTKLLDTKQGDSKVVQQILPAYERALSLEKALADIRKILESPRELKVQLTNSYRGFLSVKPKVLIAYRQARSAVDHPDVSSAVKTRFKRAEEQFRIIEKLDEQNPHQDWITHLDTLEDVNSLFGDLARQAQSDKNTAEADRESERRRARERAQRRSYSDRSSYGGYSGYSSSHDSGSWGSSSGGFSGGGGSFGGGGAGGDY